MCRYHEGVYADVYSKLTEAGFGIDSYLSTTVIVQFSQIVG